MTTSEINKKGLIIQMRTIAVLFAALVCVSSFACSSASKKDKDPDVTPGTTDVTPTEDVDAGEPATPTSEDSGTVTPPTPGKDAGSPAPHNQATCITACEVKHPRAAADNVLLDTCMLGTECGAVCNGLGTNGPNFTPTVDPITGPACDTDAAKSWSIQMHSQACADCVATHCCTLWTGIYGTAEGQGLSTCALKCFTDFKN